MKYIIMCGGKYPKWDEPRHLLEINGEPIVARTIRLLREAGADDIAISSNSEWFEDLGVPVLHHDNSYVGIEYNNSSGHWCDAFYPTDEPTTYIFGDVIFSPEAIRKIVEYEADDIMLFASKYPYSPKYLKWWPEPFAFKVTDTDHLHRTIEEVKRLGSIGAFYRKPIAWEVWNVAMGGNPNEIYPRYVAINDYTVDIDGPAEVRDVLAKMKI